MIYEDKEICAACGGFCCKKSGCDYAANDFVSINKKRLLEILEEGNVSIVGATNIITLKNGKKICDPFLYLRARNTGRDVVDIFSFKTQCSMLREDGCEYDYTTRPSGGKNLIPKGLDEDGLPLCHGAESPLKIALSWKPYQSLLAHAVKRLTGMSVQECFKRDLEEVFYDILTENFKGVSEIEIVDMLANIGQLTSIYPDVYEKARARARKNLVVLNKFYNPNN